MTVPVMKADLVVDLPKLTCSAGGATYGKIRTSFVGDPSRMHWRGEFGECVGA